MSANEELVTSNTGGKKATNNVRMDMIPVHALWEVGKNYAYGANKYGRDNWLKGYEWSLSYAALLRHLTAFWDGESIDSEGKFHHLSAVIFHAMALMEFERLGRGVDDRPLLRSTSEAPSLSSSEIWSSSESGPYSSQLQMALLD